MILPEDAEGVLLRVSEFIAEHRIHGNADLVMMAGNRMLVMGDLVTIMMAIYVRSSDVPDTNGTAGS